jgi:ACDE family multidrug resistance protein
MALRPPIRIASANTPSGLTLSTIYGLENASRATLGSIITIAGLEIFNSAKLMSISIFISSLMTLPIVLFAGNLINLFSRKYIFSFASVLIIIGSLLLSYSDIIAYTLGNILRMAGAGLTMICVSLYTMDFIPRKELAQVESRKILFAAMSWVLFPGIGTWLWVNTFKMAPFLLSSRIKEAELVKEPNKNHLNFLSNLKIYFYNPHMRVAYLIAVTRSASWVFFFTYGPIYFIEAGIAIEWVGFVMGSIISIFVFSSYFAKIGESFGIRRTIYYSFLISGISLGIIGLLPKPALIGIIFLVIATLGMDMLDIIGNLPFMRMVNPKQRTEMTTVYSTWREFSFAITPGFASLFLFFMKVQSLFIVMGLFLISAGLLSKRMPGRVD